MLPETQDRYIAAAEAAEEALIALARARNQAQEALNDALAAGGADEARGQGNIYGLVAFDKAIIQSAGAKGLVPVLEGAPERLALVGLKEGGDVAAIVKARLGVTPAREMELPRGLPGDNDEKEAVADKPLYAAVKPQSPAPTGPARSPKGRYTPRS